MLKMPTLKDMMDAGMHFGHKKERSYSKSRKYIYTIREGINIINLEKTQEMLEKALKFLGEITSKGGTILFVGTKRQAKDAVKDIAGKTGMPFVNFRWLGGTLTNFETIQKNIKKLNELENFSASDDFEKLTKKERMKINETIEKLRQMIEGIRHLKELPGCLFIIDTLNENIAVQEARMMEIPIVGVADTDANPDLIDYPIPANDDSAKSIQMIMDLVGETIKK